MEKYKVPQVYVINNANIAEELRKNYIVEEGNLGITKQINYGEGVFLSSERYLNLEYNLIDNLHEYSVVIIDLQNRGKVKVCYRSESPNSAYLFKVEYPTPEFNPTPLLMNNILSEKVHKESLKIIFADTVYREKYKMVEVASPNVYINKEEFEEDIYNNIRAYVKNKTGKSLKIKSNTLSETIGKYVLKYSVIFELPKDSNFIPLILNQDNEVVSYIGHKEGGGYELLLPLCKDKEKLISELFMQELPEMMPEYFPESKEFNWLKDKEFLPKEILESEEEKCKLKKEYDQKLLEVEEKETDIYKKYQYLNDLLFQTGKPLVAAVIKYLHWLGYEDVTEVDGSEEILREDIQIIDNDDIFIIEVKGIGGTSTDSECSQIAKHRRKRENENRDKKIIPIYIVNHQRYMKPQLRKNPPFSNEQIDYAENDERGLLTTWQLYQQFKLIEDDIFTKEETREALKDIGLVTLLPKNFLSIGIVKEYFKNKKASILNINNVEIKTGCDIWARKEHIWKKGKICSIQVDDKNVDSIENGEIGLVLDIEIAKGFELFVRK